jgi:hypothetical protein
LLVLCAPALGAQQAAAPTARTPSPTSRWEVVAPDAALAWFTVLSEWRIDSEGAFPFIVPAAASRAPTGRDEPIAREIRSHPDRGVLQFVPLYYPSADRAALAAALRAASQGSTAPTPRASFLVSALATAMPRVARRDQLPRLAAALERAQVVTPSGAELAQWQRRLDSLYVPALASWLALEHLDGGRLIVAPAVGLEGRLFAATPDRRDNLVAVGSFAADSEPDAPIFAFVREVCFPAVSRAATAARLGPNVPGAARRASVAAVRCGAALLDTCVGDRANAYRGFWIRQAARVGPIPNRGYVPTEDAELRREFDRVFPVDPALAVGTACALRRIPDRN